MVNVTDQTDPTLIENDPQQIKEFFIKHNAGHYITPQTEPLLELFSRCEVEEYTSFHSLKGNYRTPDSVVLFQLKKEGETPEFRYLVGATYESGLIIPNSRALEFLLLRLGLEAVPSAQMVYIYKQFSFPKNKDPFEFTEIDLPFYDKEKQRGCTIIQQGLGGVPKLHTLSEEELISHF